MKSGDFSRAELARALGLGEFLVLAALVVLAPVVRGETAYGSIQSMLPSTLGGDGYFLIMLAFLAALTLGRALAAGRLVVPEPAALGLLAAMTLYVAARGRFSDHPFEAGRQSGAWLSHLLLFALVLCSAAPGRTRAILVAAAAGSLAVQSFHAVYQHHVGLPQIRAMVEAGVAQPGLDAQHPGAVSRMLSDEPFSTFLHANALGGWMACTMLAVFGLLAAGTLALRRAAPAAGRGWRIPVALLLSALALAGFCELLTLPAFFQDAFSPAMHAGMTVYALVALAACLWAGRHALGLGAALVPLAWLLPGALALYAFALTGAKGAYIALAAAVPAALLAAPPADGRLRRLLRAAGGVGLAALVAGGLVWWLVPSMPGRSGLAASLGVRLGYWGPAARMLAGSPLFGIGPGKFGAAYPGLKGPMAEETQSAHSAYMETGAELGLLGLILLLAFWGWCAWRVARRVNRAEELAETPEDGAAARSETLKRLGVAWAVGTATSAAAGRLALQDASPQALATLGLVWAAAFALAAWPLAAAGRRDGPASERLLGWGLLAALAAFLVHSAGGMSMSLRSVAGPALILAALGLTGPGRRELVLTGRRLVPGILAAAAVLAAAAGLGFGEWNRASALADVEAAAAAEGTGARPLSPLDRSLLVVEAVDRALQTDPLNWPLHQQAGRAWLEAAARAPDERRRAEWLDQAELAFSRAAELAPHSSSALRPLARFHVYRRDNGALSKACREYERLEKLYPLKAEYQLEHADAELLAGAERTAVELYARALETSRGLGDENIHLSILFENYHRMRWQLFYLDALAGKLDALLAVPDGRRAPLLVRRGLVEVARGKFEAALPFLAEAARAEPSDAQLLLLRGYAERLAGQWRTALETFAAAGRLESAGGRSAGPGAVVRSRARTMLARELERKREPAAGGAEGR